MANYTYQDVIPAMIENTSMQIAYKDGVPYRYQITPVSGYVLHDKTYDYPVYNPDTGEDEIVLGYRTSTASVPYNYDFTANMYEFYTVPASEVPLEQIMGEVTPPTVTE